MKIANGEITSYDRLKSDLRGIEITLYVLFSLSLSALKSDLRGIEMLLLNTQAMIP